MCKTALKDRHTGKLRLIFAQGLSDLKSKSKFVKLTMPIGNTWAIGLVLHLS